MTPSASPPDAVPSSSATASGSANSRGPLPSGAAQPAEEAPPPPPPDVTGLPPVEVPPPPPLAHPPQPGLAVVFRRAHLDRLPYVASMGGRTACQWQRTLRSQCIENEVTITDVTHDPLYNWRQLLRSADPGFAGRIIDEGIVSVLFRIIETERDSNYTNVDGHGRHFFEFVRADGSAMRLHYHKSGRHDEPIYVGPPRGAAQPAMPGAAAPQADVPVSGAAEPAVPSGGAAQPAVPGGAAPLLFTMGHLQEAARSRQTVGRDEASAAFQTLLHHHHGETHPGAVDITDRATFDWVRWLAALEGAHNAIRGGVRKVYVVRWEENSVPEAVFCYGNNMYSTLVPRTARYTGSSRTSRFRLYREANWMTEPLLSAAPVAAQPWLVLRNQLIWD